MRLFGRERICGTSLLLVGRNGTLFTRQQRRQRQPTDPAASMQQEFSSSGRHREMRSWLFKHREFSTRCLITSGHYPTNENSGSSD
jgi:hypothetical protein